MVIIILQCCGVHLSPPICTFCSNSACEWRKCLSEGHGWKGVNCCTILYCAVPSSFTVLCSIGKGAGYKRSELSALSDGSTLVVGGKELEVL